VAPTIVRAPAVEQALIGAAPTASVLAAAAALAADAARPISDVRASREYRLALVPVITRRALHAAAERAAGRPVPVPATRYTGNRASGS
jgi:carbon-monoxide dehydrogenase medium subunit